jgi:hypothetical protein
MHQAHGENNSDAIPTSLVEAIGFRRFLVVLKGSSAVRIPHGKGARFLLGTATGKAEVRVLTNWIESGFSHPVPRELWIDVRLEAGSIDEAIDQARLLTSAVAPIVAFASNAGIGDIEPHVAFEITQGLTERSFVEYFVPDQRGLVGQSRAGDPEVIGATADAIFRSVHWGDITTALAHYFAALGHYRVGGEALAVGHLFMAAESLREATLSDYRAAKGRSETEIMANEGHEHRGHLLAWARREIIFAGDAEVHSAAKQASDGLEHGFRTVGQIRDLAEPVCDKTFTYIRTAIVDLLDLTQDARDALLKRFGTPADTQSLRRRVTGVLLGDGEELAAPGFEYPVLEWNSSLAQYDIDSDGMPTARFNDRFTVRTAEAIAFQVRSMEVYGRRQSEPELKQLNLEIQTADETKARDRVMPLIDQLARAVAACGPGARGAEFPLFLSHFLELFNRVKGLYLACVSLLQQGLAEESLILGRALMRDALRLMEAAASDEDTAKALAFGWKYDSAAAGEDLFNQWAARTEWAERPEGFEQLRSQILEVARSSGVAQPRSFAATDMLLARVGDVDYPNIDHLAGVVEQGWDIATRSRRRKSSEGTYGLHDTAPDSWVYPLAAKYIGGSCLIAMNSAIQLFAWEDPGGQVAAATSALKAFDASFGSSTTDEKP